MSLRIVVLILLCCSALACASTRRNARVPIEEATKPLTSSPYEPEPQEDCEFISQSQCSYVSSPFKQAWESCGESVAVEAAAAGANYVFVKLPKSVAGIKVNTPRANLYRCANLIDD